MTEINAPGLDDDRIASAAKRIIRQFQLERQEPGDGGLGAARRSPGAPDDIQGLRLAVDDMGLAIDHMQKLMGSREDVFLAALERMERKLAVTTGRVDALAENMAQLVDRPVLDADSFAEEQRAITTSVMREFAGMMDLGRTLLDEARQMHATASEAISASIAQDA